jgi:SPP1 family predicted phage head-tail adaptor
MLSTRGNNNPGRLDRRVILQYKSATRDAMGGEVIEWINGATVWAMKVPVGGGRMFSADAKQFDSSLQYIIRHRTDIEAGWRVVHGDDTFEVTFVDPGESRDRYLTLFLRGLNQSIGTTDRGIDVRLLHDDSSRLLHDDSYVLLHS